MVKKILVECERSFKIFNKVIGNNEIHSFNEKELLAVLRRAGKITMFELNEDGTQRVPITLSNYNTETIFPKVEKKVEEPVAPVVEEKKVVNPAPVPVATKVNKKEKRADRPVVPNQTTPEPESTEEGFEEVVEEVAPVEEAAAPTEEEELAKLEAEIKALESEEDK